MSVLLRILEHSSPTYSPRTYHNARRADLTLALALDFNTAGERLTRKAAGARYLGISLLSDPGHAADQLLQALCERTVRILNIAGNGLYTLGRAGWAQERANAFVFAVLSRASPRWALAQVISGGQTGIDLAGITAAHALGIATEMTLPKGFLQRGADGCDRTHSAEDIRRQVEEGVTQLRGTLPQPKPARTPRLLNIKRDQIPPDAVYIGRNRFRGQTSVLGNPYEIGRDGDRNEVVEKFERWAPTKPHIMAAIAALRGRDLACYCVPDRCHGEFILRVANQPDAPEDLNPQSPRPTECLHFDPQI